MAAHVIDHPGDTLALCRACGATAGETRFAQPCAASAAARVSARKAKRQQAARVARMPSLAPVVEIAL